MDKFIQFFSSLKDNKFIKSCLTFKGDKVDMSMKEMLIYGLVPGIGQLLMRIDKFGGSLDKPYLLFPLLFFPPFSFIPVLVAKFGFLKKDTGVHVIDFYILIPIIIRFIIILLLFKIINPSNILGLLITIILVFGGVTLANYMHLTSQEKCKDVSSTFINKLIKSASDASYEYATGVGVLFLTTFIPVVGEIIDFIREIPLPFIGNLSQLIDTSIWGIGLICGYLILNMVDVNYFDTSTVCGANINKLRIIIGAIAFVMSVGFQLLTTIL